MLSLNWSTYLTTTQRVFKKPSVKNNSEQLKQFYFKLQSEKPIIETIDRTKDKLLKEELLIEFPKLIKPNRTTFHSEGNTDKNKLHGHHCFDHSRVVLSKEYPNSSDFINANYVDGYLQSKKFILTQSPKTFLVADFWHMLWDQRTLVIAMVTNATEIVRNQTKTQSRQYFAEKEGDFMTFNIFAVQTIAFEETPDYVVTELEVTNLKVNETRHVTHCRIISWPDLKLPVSTTATINFIKFLQNRQDEMVRELGDEWTGQPWGPPIVVHCYAGFGRTGTLAVIFRAMMLFDVTKTFNFFDTVISVRNDRQFALETFKQYCFVHHTLIEYAESFLEFSQNFNWEKLI